MPEESERESRVTKRPFQAEETAYAKTEAEAKSALFKAQKEELYDWNGVSKGKEVGGDNRQLDHVGH